MGVVHDGKCELFINGIESLGEATYRWTVEADDEVDVEVFTHVPGEWEWERNFPPRMQDYDFSIRDGAGVTRPIRVQRVENHKKLATQKIEVLDHSTGVMQKKTERYIYVTTIVLFCTLKPPEPHEAVSLARGAMRTY